MYADVTRVRSILAFCLLPLTCGFAVAPATAATTCAKPFADARPRGSVASWVTGDDYPQQALRAEISGPA